MYDKSKRFNGNRMPVHQNLFGQLFSSCRDTQPLRTVCLYFSGERHVLEFGFWTSVRDTHIKKGTVTDDKYLPSVFFILKYLS